MQKLGFISLLLLTMSCEIRTVKYSGLNDLVVGIQQVVLYENGEFRLELGAGETEGTYKIENDTVYLEYFDKLENWADRLLMTNNYFITIYTDSLSKPVKIKRWTEF